MDIDGSPASVGVSKEAELGVTLAVNDGQELDRVAAQTQDTGRRTWWGGGHGCRSMGHWFVWYCTFLGTI